ncbi:MAG TPA: aldehyde dehydrogenase family protein, partial [Streptosporangiaceae bacterium]
MSTPVRQVCEQARAAAAVARELDASAKDAVLADLAEAIESGREELKAANQLDVAAARQAGVSATLVDRLTLTDARISAMANAVRTVAALPDPVGQVTRGTTRPNGLLIEQVREPLGVVAVVYEARPNVTVDVAALCLKSGNACILRGGSESIHSNRAIAACVRAGLRAAKLPEGAVQLVET